MSDLPFTPGRIYVRKELHAEYGGQSRGGISTPTKWPFVFLFSGESGEAYGYRDRWIGEMYHYTGEGQIGDMQMVRGNQAIEGHAIRGKRLLLFTDIGKGRCRFAAEMIFERRYPEKRTDRAGKERNALVFVLQKADAEYELLETAGYVTSRAFKLPVTPEDLTSATWFNLWKNRQWPYHDIVAGDLLYWYETPTRRLVWKSQVSAIDRFQYSNKEDLAERIQSTLGPIDKGESYFVDGPAAGYCLAWKVALPRKLALVKPDGIQIPQNGWLRLDRLTAERWLQNLLNPGLQP